MAKVSSTPSRTATPTSIQSCVTDSSEDVAEHAIRQLIEDVKRAQARAREELLTVKEFGNRIGYGEAGIWKLLRENRLPENTSLHIGRKRRFRASIADAIISGEIEILSAPKSAAKQAARAVRAKALAVTSFAGGL